MKKYMIEVDFDVYKILTYKRETEEMTENHVLRDLLGLPKIEKISDRINIDLFEDITKCTEEEILEIKTLEKQIKELAEQNELLKHETSALRSKQEYLKALAIITSTPMNWNGFPDSTMFRAKHKGQIFEAHIENGRFIFNNHFPELISNEEITSLSGAAKAVTGTNINGNMFWKVKLPNTNEWIPAPYARARLENIKNAE
jgi:hypothetical protein